MRVRAVVSRRAKIDELGTLIAASEASSDPIFDDSRTTRAPADGKNPVPADIIGSQTKMLWGGQLAGDG